MPIIKNMKKKKIRDYYKGVTKVDNVPRDISRVTYKRTDIDWNYIKTPPGDKTNLQLAQGGYTPFGKDGELINLHHFTQEEPGVVIEVLGSVHIEDTKLLHIFAGDGDSFRNIYELDRQFENFRKRYWKWRVSQVSN